MTCQHIFLSHIFFCARLSQFQPGQEWFLQWTGRDMDSTWMLFHTTSHLFWEWRKGSLPGRSSIVEGAVGFCLLSRALPMNRLPLSCTLCHQHSCSYLSFSYLPAVSTKSFLSQPTIFTFSSSNSPLHSTPRHRGEGRGSKRAAHGLGSLSGSTILGSTIPKP